MWPSLGAKGKEGTGNFTSPWVWAVERAGLTGNYKVSSLQKPGREQQQDLWSNMDTY